MFSEIPFAAVKIREYKIRGKFSPVFRRDAELPPRFRRDNEKYGDRHCQIREPV